MVWQEMEGWPNVYEGPATSQVLILMGVGGRLT